MSEQPEVKRLTIRLEFLIDDDTNPDLPRAVTDSVAIIAALADAGFDGGEISMSDGPIRKDSPRRAARGSGAATASPDPDLAPARRVGDEEASGE